MLTAIASSALLAQMVFPGGLIGLAIIFFIIAAAAGILLVVNILRSDTDEPEK